MRSGLAALSAVVLVACSGPSSPYAQKCNAVTMGTMIDRLPATQVDAEAPSYGIYLQAVAGWKEACTVIPDPCLADAGCPRLDLPDGGHMLNPDVCGVHYSLRPPYRGDACNVGGTVEHCEVWARDGGVVASHAFCSD